MAYKATIILDSYTRAGDRLTTIEVTYPRFIHSEVLTHRAFSRNSSSSRAIPIERLIKRVIDDPVMPVWWGKNQSGMQAREELSTNDKREAEIQWLQARNEAVRRVRFLVKVGAHKQIVNRIIEPWMWITTIISATDYENFFNLRCHADAQPEIQKIAYMMRDLYRENTPALREAGEWHLPYITDEDRLKYGPGDLLRLSVARCARVSYLTHDGEHDPGKDLGLYQYLWDSGHWSPFEHQAMPGRSGERSGNFTGWAQHRHTSPV